VSAAAIFLSLACVQASADSARPAARPASLDAKPAIKAKPAVVALPPSPAPVDTAIDAPPKEKWVDKLHQDIHESKLRMEKWNEEIKSQIENYRKRQVDQQDTGSGTAIGGGGGSGGRADTRALVGGMGRE
jgi:hypothetical protein